MPERNLVAVVRYKLQLRSSRGQVASVVLLLSLTMATGCSNLHLNSIGDAVLPVPPSQISQARPINVQDDSNSSAAETESGGDSSIAAANTVGKTLDELLPAPILEATLPPKSTNSNAFEIPKLSAIPTTPPAPTVVPVTHQQPGNATEYNAGQQDASHERLEKSQQLRLTKVEPVDPETVFPTKDLVRSNPLRPLLLNSVAASSEQPPVDIATEPTKGSVAPPIKLVALPSSSAEIQLEDRPSPTAVSQTENRAQMLLPIGESAIQKFKAELAQRDHAEAAITQPVEPLPDLKVRDIIIDPQLSATETIAARSQPVEIVAAAQAGESASQKGEPRDSSVPSIRVSSVPFGSLRTKPAPAHKQSLSESIGRDDPSGFPALPSPEELKTSAAPKFVPFGIKPMAKAAVDAVDQVIANDNGTDNAFDIKAADDAPMPVVPQSELVAEIDSKNDFQPATPTMSKQIDLPLPMFKASPIPESRNHANESVGLEEIPKLSDLPDMQQIEKDLEAFDRANTFDPSSIDRTASIDPALLRAKLPAENKLPVPVRFAQQSDTSSTEKTIVQQLADQQAALEQLTSAVEELESPAASEAAVADDDPRKFSIGNATFCTKIEGFGKFKPFASNTFAGDQRTLVYCEVENHTSRSFSAADGSLQYETILRGSVVIYNERDEVVQSNSFPKIIDTARQPRRDFYVYFPIALDHLVPGDYRMELQVDDDLDRRTATLQPSIEFQVR